MMGELARLRVAAYARYSSERQNDSSIDDQLRRCRDFVVERGGSIDGSLIFTDHAISGTTMARAGMDAMLAAVAAGRVDVLVCEDISRLSRDLGDAANLFKQLEAARVRLFGIADGIDSHDKSAKLNFGFRALLVAVYVDDLKDKTRRGLKGRHLAGKATGATPFGYVTKRTDSGSEILIHSERAEIVRCVFRLYLDGLSHASIAKQLNDDGVEVPRHHLKRATGWTRSTVREMLKQKKYVGDWTYNEYEWRKGSDGKRRRHRRPKSEVLEDIRPWLAIVDESTWSAVQSRMPNRSAQKTGGKRRVYPLSGVLRCGACGSTMSIAGAGKYKRYYCAARRDRHTCQNALSVREADARAGITRMIRSRLGRPAAIDYLRARIKELIAELSGNTQDELKRRRTALARTERKLRNLLEAVADGMKSAEVYKLIDAKEAEAAHIREAITRLEAEAPEGLQVPQLNDLVDRAAGFDRFLDDDPLRAREALRRLFPDGVSLEPDGDVYVAKATLFPLEVLGVRDAEKARSKRKAPLRSDGCGGRI